MPSDKPRVTLRLDEEDMECLEFWAKNEFLTVPQLTRVVVKKAIAEYLKQHPRETVEDVPKPKPTAATKTATATRRGRINGKG
jgi:hypothetical protein